jgi:hypothetical protein
MVNKKCIPHNKILYTCVPCKGAGICEHEKRRDRCVLCKGAGICEHEKRRSRCKDCKGGQICEHEKIRSQCKDCEGSQICEHEKIRGHCKVCGDEIHITIMKLIRSSKQSDKKKNIYDETNFIDYEFCKELIKESGKFCYYCDIELQYIEYNDTLATIERLDNDIGHIKENCVIACRTCNFSRVGDRT